MSMPLPAERGVPSHSEEWVPRSPEAHGWACRSFLSGGVPSHSEEWVLHSPELVIGLTLRSEFSALELLIGSWVSLIPRNEFSALQSSPSVELALLPSTRGSPMSMPLPSERPSFLRPPELCDRSLACWSSQHCSPQPEGHLWACRSLLSVWVPSHSEEWVVLRSRA